MNSYIEEKLGINNLDFGVALDALKHGYKVARKGWNGKGMYVFTVELRINEMSLKFLDNKGLVIKTPKGELNNWVPSITDLFAEDWEIVE